MNATCTNTMSMNTASMNAARAGYGLARLIRPQQLDDEPHGADDHTHTYTVDRLLGTRQIVQAIVLQAVPTNVRVLLLGASVDLLHAASMLALAGISGPRRRAALAEAVAALGFAAAGAFAAQRARPCSTDDRSATA